FTDFLNKNARISFHYDSQKGVDVKSKIAPSITSIKSFATNYRIFTSDENISIKNLNKFTKDTDISDEWKKKYLQAREQINLFLREETNFHIGEGGNPLTREEIAKTFINGWIFHVKDDKKTDIYQNW